MLSNWVLLLLACLLWASCVGAQHQQQHRTSQRYQVRARRRSEAVSIASGTLPSSPVSPAKPAAALSPSNSAVAGGGGSGNWCQLASNSSWPLTAISAAMSKLPVQTQRVLICIISTGVSYKNRYLKHNSWSGCNKEDPLDPGGCIMDWQDPLDNKGNWKPRGTYAAAVMAARPGQDQRISGVIPGKADMYVVPVDTDTGATDPASQASGGKSRIRAYSNCEGRLRGLQAQDVGVDAPAVRWRMVVYVDVKGTTPAAQLGTRDYKITESDWLATALGTTEDGHQPDVLVVAPAGDTPGRVAYPAADSHVIAVGGYGCDGQPMTSYSSNNTSSKAKPDILAPGQHIPVPDVRKDGKDGIGIRFWDGSAPAAAYTTAVAARLWSAYPHCSADVIRQALLSSNSGASLPAILNLQTSTAYLEQPMHKCTAI